VSIDKLWQMGLTRTLGRKGYKELAKNVIYVAFGRGLNFIWFAFTLIWFWAGWKQIDDVFSALGVVQWLGVWLAAWLCSTAVLAAWEWLRAALLSIKTSEGPVLTSRYARVIYASAFALTAFVISAMLNQPAPGIVYKTF